MKWCVFCCEISFVAIHTLLHGQNLATNLVCDYWRASFPARESMGSFWFLIWSGGGLYILYGQVSGSHVYLEDLGWPIWHLPAAIVLCVSCSEKRTRRHADPEVCIRGSEAGGPCVSSSDRDNVLLSPGHSLLSVILTHSNPFTNCRERFVSMSF